MGSQRSERALRLHQLQPKTAFTAAALFVLAREAHVHVYVRLPFDGRLRLLLGPGLLNRI